MINATRATGMISTSVPSRPCFSGDADHNHVNDIQSTCGQPPFTLGKGAKKKEEKKLTSVSFMYVCVAGNGEMLVFFFLFSPIIV